VSQLAEPLAQALLDLVGHGGGMALHGFHQRSMSSRRADGVVQLRALTLAVADEFGQGLIRTDRSPAR
jgi:hypothetical protein